MINDKFNIEQLTKMVVQELDSEVEQLYQDAEDYLWQDTGEPRRTIGVKGEGAWFTDIYGKEFFEATSGHSCLNLGYGQQELVDAASEQMQKLAYFSPAELQVPAIKLAKKLSQLFQGDYRTFFSPSGSEANEVALKVARQYHIQTGNPAKYKFISHYHAYHGATTAVQSHSAAPTFKTDFPGSFNPGAIHVFPPNDYRCAFGDNVESCEYETAKYIEKVIIREEANTVAGIFIEPVLFAGGCYAPSKKYLQYLAEISEKHNVLLIVDEVVSGFGRTGKWFGYQHSDGVQPDIITTAKGITSSYIPLGATSVSKKVFSTFNNTDHRFRHFSTMGSHPVGCAVALKTIEIMEKQNIVEKVAHSSDTIMSKLHNLKSLDIVGDVRGKGYMYAVEFVENKHTKEPLNDEVMSKIDTECINQGLLISTDKNIIRMNPPLVSTESDLHFLVDTLSSIARKYSNN